MKHIDPFATNKYIV